MNKLFFIIKISLVLIIFTSLSGFGFIGYILWKYSPDLPSYEKIKNYQPNLSSRIYTSDGLLLEKFFVQERIFVPINRIPKALIEAFLAAEDKKFYSHIGIDPIAILRASVTNLINSYQSKKLIGASTIKTYFFLNTQLYNQIFRFKVSLQYFKLTVP